MFKYVWTKFEILTPYISWDTVHFVEILTIDPKLLLHFYGFSMGYIWGKTNFEKTYPKEFFDAFWWFECEKVDLTAEIKISQNVLSSFGALYSPHPHTLTHSHTHTYTHTHTHSHTHTHILIIHTHTAHAYTHTHTQLPDRLPHWQWTTIRGSEWLPPSEHTLFPVGPLSLLPPQTMCPGYQTALE